MAEIKQIRLSGVTYDIVDDSAIHSLDGYWNSGQTENAITAATAALAETIAEQGYQTSGDVQNAISGKADTSALTVYADAVAYDSNSKEMKFYNGGTGGTEVYHFDASPFLIDGMVENVEIKDVTISGESVTCLVVTFNTDAGKQEIDIPLTEIFDASNYYTKTEVDNVVSASTSGKVDTSTYDTYTAATDTAIAGKQATLVSGTNIKTINSQSLLGAGDITIQSGNQVEVSGTTLVFL